MLLLDTCSWLWYANEANGEWSAAARKQLRAAEHLAVSVISAWEVANLVARGRITLACDVDTWVAQAVVLPKIELIPLSLKIAIESTRLPGEFHKDPGDRMLVATARALSAPILTPDKRIREYPHARSVW